MGIIVLNILRGVKKRLFQYIGIALLLIIIVATMTGLYGSSDRGQAGFVKLEKNSGTYDYRIDTQLLTDYKNSDEALVKVKAAIKKSFPTDLPDYSEIQSQIESITSSNLQNNSLPSGTLNEKLKLYLLNWGVNYKVILLNDILNTEVKNDPATTHYQIDKSFLKSFNYNDKEKKLFFAFEDAFYLNPMPFAPAPGQSEFDFMPERNGSNEVYLVDGRKPTAVDEVVINPTFAKKNHIALDSSYQFIPEQTLKVVGFGYTYWGIIPPLTADNVDANPNNTTAVFATREWLNEYLYNNSSYLSNLSIPFFLRVANKDVFFQDKVESIFNQFFNFNYGSLIIANGDDLRSGAMRQNYNMQNIVFASISFIVLLAVIFIVLSYVKKEIDLQKKQIGLIKALGYNNNEISFGFTLLFFILSIISTCIGFALGLPLQMRFNSLADFGFFLPMPPVYFSVLALIFSVVVTTIIFTLASYLQATNSLSKEPLLLIYDRTTNTSAKWLAIFKKPFNYWKFKPRLAVSFALKSVGKLALIFLIFIFASFLLMFENVALDVFDSKIDNFYSFMSKDVYTYNPSINMYKFDDSGKITDQIYDWVLEKNLDSEKEIKSDTFHIDTAEKKTKLYELMAKESYKGYYITSAEINLLYENTQDPDDPNKCIEYVRAGHPEIMSESEATLVCQGLTKFFNLVAEYSGGMQPLPGFAIGQNVLNNNYYPNLEFRSTTPVSWSGHDQGPMNAKWIDVISLYNDSNPDNPLAWKSWFNFKEEKGYDIDPVFNSSHNLSQQQVTYVDGFGDTKTETAYVIPTVISKVLATLNKYKVNDQQLAIINANGRFIPIIFDIKGITTKNLDIATSYINIDDLRKAVGYLNDQGQPITDSFNNFYSKDSSSIFPLNSINIAQLDNDYSMNGLQNGAKMMNEIPIIMPLVKDRLGQIFDSIKTIIEISKWLTIIALAFVLIIIVNMILDNNLMIIAMMKALGYRINEINLLIIGSYIFTLILAFILGSIFSYLIWGVILWIVAKLTSTIFLLPISALTIFLSFLLIFVVIIIGYIVGLYFIKFKPVSSLLQSD
ncbi:ABC transporter permease [Spiroplasma platyhelix]|uniref:ABC transporter permease n=1 Tax=Spiroplasma platyhelix PALS-1 TaxID=1276218 RepID=A0A846U545_9MOLU|nr:ABC transporter permease [Spiroplasma platyhelix]MBE4704204.1 hypothetical protein [Spiroplasma platyhelix PALS-1]NKE38577.1 ABC transporter permease [Spiroplasma platyhelix PALS-1]UJB28788.1 hypothetical protein SPLAT_v1c00210 [Spiroplasma platyhelix PALS-1]